MANKINLKGGKIEFKQGIIFFGIPDEGDKFVITCESAVLNTHNPESNSLVLCLEDIYYEINEQALNDFVAAFYVTPAEVAEFLEDEFSFNISFTTLYDINRDNNVITITKKTNEHFIGTCKLIIYNSIPASSITFIDTIYAKGMGVPSEYIKFILSIDGVTLTREYTSSAMGIDILPTTIATNFKTSFDSHPTLSTNYIMTRNSSTLTITKKIPWASNPIIALSKDFQHSALVYKYEGTAEDLIYKSVTFKIYPSSPALDHFDVNVIFNPPNPLPPGYSWMYDKIYSKFSSHDDWGWYINSEGIIIYNDTVPSTTISFTLYRNGTGDLFNEVATVSANIAGWSLHAKVTYIPLYNYTGYTINNSGTAPYNAPEFIYKDQLIRGQLIEEEEEE